MEICFATTFRNVSVVRYGVSLVTILILVFVLISSIQRKSFRENSTTLLIVFFPMCLKFKYITYKSASVLTTSIVALLKQHFHSCLVTARVRSTREGNVLTSVCPSIHPSVCPQGGVPISHNALQHFPECHEAAGGARSGPPPGGYPDPPSPGGTRTPPGVPEPPLGGTRTPQGVPEPPGGTQTPRGGGQVPPPARTEGVLTTRRAVCLLRSRRRTFLFN